MSNLYERIFEILMHRSSLALLPGVWSKISDAIIVSCAPSTSPFDFHLTLYCFHGDATTDFRNYANVRDGAQNSRMDQKTNVSQRLCNPFWRILRINLTVSIQWAPNTTQPAFNIDGASCAHSIFARVSAPSDTLLQLFCALLKDFLAVHRTCAAIQTNAIVRFDLSAAQTWQQMHQTKRKRFEKFHIAHIFSRCPYVISNCQRPNSIHSFRHMFFFCIPSCAFFSFASICGVRICVGLCWWNFLWLRLKHFKNNPRERERDAHASSTVDNVDWRQNDGRKENYFW